MAKATATKKPVVRRRRERKNIENGSAHILSLIHISEPTRP